jgi:hypothetical protein
MTAFEHSSQPSPEVPWPVFQALHPVYQALVCEFVIEVPTCPFGADTASGAIEGATAQAETWLQQVDTEIQVHQLRQFLQTTPLANEAVLRDLLVHHLRKPVKSSSDRDKIDFLLVQYFSFCAPSDLDESNVDLEFVAQTLAPVLGQQKSPLELPAWLAPLETLRQSAARCCRLSDLLHSGTLEQGRKLKAQAGNRFFDSAAMAAFVRFSFMIRRLFFRLMHDDLNAIQDGLRELERRGIHTIDCRRAQFSAEEPTSRLRMICQSWKVMFHAEYSSGQPLRMLVDLRAAVDDALQSGAQEAPLAARAATAPSESGTGAKQ